MTLKYLPLFILLLATSCAQKKSHESIQKQIDEVTTQYNKSWETLDLEKIAAFHSAESFLYWSSGGLSCGSNEEFRNVFGNILPMMKTWTIKDISSYSVQVLGPDAAVASLLLNAESVGQDGSVSNHGSGALTYVWNRIDGDWKIVHIHESTK
jgi:ketosteroid isomerase-like protein